ncbi:DUF1329 domain-containing protein [Stutzerimonas kunmingensis]|nr:DUF1329 domain-containing protein [Stutzerimonas kunmingensis]
MRVLPRVAYNAAMCLFLANQAWGNPNAARLGDDLTPFGSLRAGNAEGSIPAYSGGLSAAPEGFEAASGYWKNPFQDEKPLLRIDANNMHEYTDKLSEGQRKLLKTYPDYYMPIYPTHRTAGYPQHVLEATKRNASVCKTARDYLAVSEACRGGIPFPLPANGYEVMWNQMLSYYGETAIIAPHNRSWSIDVNGTRTMTADQKTFSERTFYQTALADRDPQMYWRTYSITQAPARKAGEITGLLDFIDPLAKPRRAWSYTAGQRRVKLAPEFAYDTPVASLGGGLLFDELFVFSGRMDRFNFKYLGTREMYIPYNNYDLYTPSERCNGEGQFTGTHINPACERFELHRVRVVEATLKEGMRHAYSKRVYYLDEDLSGAALVDAYDHNGELHRTMANTMVQLYDHGIPWAVRSHTYDFNKRMLTVLGDFYEGGFEVMDEPMSNRSLNPEAVTARETVR